VQQGGFRLNGRWAASPFQFFPLITLLVSGEARAGSGAKQAPAAEKIGMS